jgi:hypothetical protein
VQLEGVGQLKNPMTSSGIEPRALRRVVLPQPTTLPRATPFNCVLVSILFAQMQVSISSKRQRNVLKLPVSVKDNGVDALLNWDNLFT